MHLICKRNVFPKHPERRAENAEPLTLPLTVGRAYQVQMVVQNGDAGSFMGLNALQSEDYVLLVFTDNQLWEVIAIPQNYMPSECEHMDFVNQQFKSVFEDPK